MMNKLRNWMNKPVTWGGYLKICGFCIVASVIYLVCFFAYLYGVFDQVVLGLRRIFEKIKRFFKKEYEEREIN